MKHFNFIFIILFFLFLMSCDHKCLNTDPEPDPAPEEPLQSSWRKIQSFFGLAVYDGAVWSDGIDLFTHSRATFKYSPSDSEEVWERVAINVPVSTKESGIFFNIGNSLFYGGGIPLGTGLSRSRDFWEFDVETSTWTIRDSLPILDNLLGISFEAGGRGWYLPGSPERLYVYLSPSDTSVSASIRDNWATLFLHESFPPVLRTRSEMTVFSTMDRAYVGLGYDSNTEEFFNDFYEFTPSDQSWRQIADFPGEARAGAVAFEIQGKGYVGLGFSESEMPLRDLFRYDPSTDTWEQMEDYPGAQIDGITATATNIKGYLGLSGSETWEYTPPEPN